MGRIEILSGRERRRNWTDEQKRAIVEEAATSGLALAVVARRHDIVPQQIYTWRREVRLAAPLAFAPVALIAPAASDAPQRKNAERRKVSGNRAAQIEIHCANGRVLKVASNLDAEVLKTLIRSVEDA
ncbi:transposase [Rhodoblastus sphagnicola]|uniref:IS66-like element accessory protein TnpA n=1 Tax=Rhodoblastus sphagnicola TaxID=333368 RepID=UPI00161BE932|nr:transposase [Rhodoblastus sphagnicola]MBB4201208.1 transposase [Rhodoblastus sphagnicola]